MTKTLFGIFTVALVFAGVSAKADKVLFDGSKAALSRSTVKVDPEKADNKTAFWNGSANGYAMNLKLADKDLSKYKALSFRMYASEAAKGDAFIIVMPSENKESKGGDYYYKKVTIDWKGWKTFVVPLDKFGKARKPLGLNQVSNIMFCNKGWGLKPNKAAKYYIDDIKLIAK
jgi:hypothetical protein